MMAKAHVSNGKWPKVKLADVAEQCLGKMLDAKKNKGTLMPYLRNPNVRWFNVDTSELQMMPFEDREHDRYGLIAGDIVICEGGDAGRAAIWDGRMPDLKFQKAIHRVRPGPRLHNRYFVHRLMDDHQNNRLGDYLTGATIKHFTGRDLSRYEFLLPPLAEQKRIAGILDAADALRAKRRAALAQLDSLTQSLFLDLFGDPVSNPMGWEKESFDALVGSTFRNGLSPSTKGKVEGRVLTLSAITSGAYNSSYSKSAMFDRVPSKNQMLSPETFLICRGNGNKSMVGIGVYPNACDEEVCFPDTMIACTPDAKVVQRRYVQAVWASKLVRNQIDSGARTTNGTFKVNQSVLGSVIIPIPPLPLQRRFAAMVESIERQKTRHRAHLAELDALFASLQHRAFRGEL